MPFHKWFYIVKFIWHDDNLEMSFGILWTFSPLNPVKRLKKENVLVRCVQNSSISQWMMDGSTTQLTHCAYGFHSSLSKPRDLEHHSTCSWWKLVQETMHPMTTLFSVEILWRIWNGFVLLCVWWLLLPLRLLRLLSASLACLLMIKMKDDEKSCALSFVALLLCLCSVEKK